MFVKFFCKIFMNLFFDIRVSGVENVCDVGGFILISNHQSNWDPIFLGLNLKRRLFFMAKSELFCVPVLSFIIKKLGAFPVKRGANDHLAIDAAINLLRAGNVLAMFPEGHRSKNGEILKFKTGVVRIALKGDFKILPCSVLYEKRKFRKKVFVSYGHAFRLNSFFESKLKSEKLSFSDIKKLNDYVRNKVIEVFMNQKSNF